MLRPAHSLVSATLAFAIVFAAIPSQSESSTPLSPHRSTHSVKRVPSRTAKYTQKCQQNGQEDFEGGGTANVSGGIDSGWLTGYENQACDLVTAIVAGEMNTVYGNDDTVAQESVIVGGDNNVISTASGFIGAGTTNVVAGNFSSIAAGTSNVAHGNDVAVAGGSYNSANGDNSFIGGGTNGDTNGQLSFIGGGFENFTGPDAAVAAGSNNQAAATNSAVGAGIKNLNDGTDGFIGAGAGNAIASGAAGGFVGAGEDNGANGVNSFVGAGGYDEAKYQAFVGSGYDNAADGSQSFVGAGEYNKVTATDAFVGGGNTNTASGQDSTIGGGTGNVASGYLATIAGGYHNYASGQTSFAGGFGSYALHTGTFVWSDSTSGAAHLTSSAANQFLVRSTGGVKFFTNAKMNTGVMLAPGSGAWSSASDRNLKRDVAKIDDGAVLDKVAALPISRWSYTSEGHVRHIGPMAQDFYAAFNVGEDDRHITTIDEDGVALSAVKALYRRSMVAESENRRLRSQLQSVQQRLDELSAAVAALRRR